MRILRAPSSPSPARPIGQPAPLPTKPSPALRCVRAQGQALHLESPGRGVRLHCRRRRCSVAAAAGANPSCRLLCRQQPQQPWATARRPGTSAAGRCTSCRSCGWRRCGPAGCLSSAAGASRAGARLEWRHGRLAAATAQRRLLSRLETQPLPVSSFFLCAQARKYVPPELPLVSFLGWTLGGFYLARYSGAPGRLPYGGCCAAAAAVHAMVLLLHTPSSRLAGPHTAAAATLPAAAPAPCRLPRGCL